MKYMLMIYDRADYWDETTLEVQEQDIATHQAFTAYLRERGIAFSGEALMSPSAATTLHKSGDEIVFTDGPFAELKEVLGGFYIFEAADLDDAMEVARHCPVDVGLELRPVWE
ncbi:MAG: YciI family protein [Thermomicrobiales bacterium]